MKKHTKSIALSAVAGVTILTGMLATYGVKTNSASNKQYVVLDTEDNEIYSDGDSYYYNKSGQPEEEDDTKNKPTSDEQSNGDKNNKTDKNDKTKKDTKEKTSLVSLDINDRRAESDQSVFNEHPSITKGSDHINQNISHPVHNNNNRYVYQRTSNNTRRKHQGKKQSILSSSSHKTQLTSKPENPQVMKPTDDAYKQSIKDSYLKEIYNLKYLNEDKRKNFKERLQNATTKEAKNNILKQALEEEHKAYQLAHHNETPETERPKDNKPDNIYTTENQEIINKEKPHYIEPAEKYVSTPVDQPATVYVPNAHLNEPKAQETTQNVHSQETSTDNHSTNETQHNLEQTNDINTLDQLVQEINEQVI